MNANDLADRLEQFYQGTHITKAAEELRRLYTYSVKELTDEEIDNVSDKVSNLIDTYAGRREFARAILRKAQDERK